MPKYTDEAGIVIDTGEVSIKDMQDEAKRLLGHNNTLLSEKRAEAEKRKAAEEAVAAAQAEVTSVKTTIESEWAQKLTAKETELASTTAIAEKYKKSVLDMAVNGPASELANKLTTAPELALPHIKQRLTAEVSAEGEIVTKVVGKDGKPSEMSIDDLMKELAADTKLAPIIKASQARGGGNGPAHTTSGTKPSGTQTETVAEAAARRIAARAAEGK